MIIKIRRSEFKDWQIIQKLNFGMYAHQAQFDPYLDMDEPFSKESVKDYQDDVSNPKKCVFIAEIDGQSVGYLVGEKTKINYRKLVLGEINHMAVDEKYRGHGIGSKL